MSRTAHDDHWAFVPSPETSIPKDKNQNLETQPFARGGGGGRRNYHLEEDNRDDRRKSRISKKNQYPIDTNDAVGKCYSALNPLLN